MSYFFNQLRTNAFTDVTTVTKRWTYDVSGSTAGILTTLAFHSSASNKTVDLRNASGSVVLSSVPWNTNLTVNGVSYADSINTVAFTAAGTSGQVLKAVTASAPVWGAVDLTTDVGSSILPVANGGTGVATLALNGLVIGNGTSPVTTAVGTNGQYLSNVAGVPTWVAAPTFSDKVAYTVLTVAQKLQDLTAELVIGNVPWDNTLLSAYTTRAVRLWIDFSGAAGNLVVRIRTGGLLGTVIDTSTIALTSTSGLFSIAMSAPGADTFLTFTAEITGAGAADYAEIQGITLTLNN